MKKEAIQKYMITEEKEQSLWSDGIIVFDSSAILDLYFLPKTARVKISTEIFEKLKDRLWIPNHVQFEYLKNREKIIKKPVAERYDPLRKKVVGIADSIKKDVSNRIEEIIRETQKDDKHPHIDQEQLLAFKEKLDKLKEESLDFVKSMNIEIKKKEDEIMDVSSNDDVLKSLEEHFKVGREFSFSEIMEITQEGKHRFEFKIPPG